MVQMTCGCMNLTSLLTDFRRGNLAYREWIPYEWSDTMYYLTYFRQLIGLTVASIVNVACDILICGFLKHIYCQIEILECRLKKSLRDQGDLGECVRLHDHIYKLVIVQNFMRLDFFILILKHVISYIKRTSLYFVNMLAFGYHDNFIYYSDKNFLFEVLIFIYK